MLYGAPYPEMMSDQEEALREWLADTFHEAWEQVTRASILLREASGLNDELGDRRESILAADAAKELERFNAVWLEATFGVEVAVSSAD